MPDLSFILPDGEHLGFESPSGVNLMQAATGYGVPGIVGECGGLLRCATCHVIVDPAWTAKLPPPGVDESAMLDLTAVERQPGSRLACQIQLDDSLQGLVVQVPASQY